jgi:hypothetical protein
VEAGTNTRMTLAEAFERSPLNQRELAHKLKTGETQVSRWIREERGVTKLRRPAVAKALGCRVEDIAWKEWGQ